MIGPTPKGTQEEIDAGLTDILRHGTMIVKTGWKAIVPCISIDASPRHTTVGVEYCRGRVLWFDMPNRVPFWTLRSREGSRIGGVVDTLGRWLIPATPPPMRGLSTDEVRERLIRAITVLRVNPYSHNFDFDTVVVPEAAEARTRLDEAESLLGTWAILARDHAHASVDGAVDKSPSHSASAATADLAPVGEWVGPMTKVELARRVTGGQSERWRKVSPMFGDDCIQRVSPRTFRFRIDHLDEPTRAKCRGQVKPPK